MKLLFIFAVTVAFALAEEFQMEEEPIDDLQAAASMELQKSERRSPPYVPPTPWNRPSNNYYNPTISSVPSVAPAPAIPSPPSYGGNYYGGQNDPPQNNYYQPNPAPSNTWDNQNSWNNNQNQNTWNNPQNTGSNYWTKPQNTGSENWNNQNTNNWNNWNQKPISTSTTTTPVPVIKNEHFIGDDGSYKYEYQIADGTHVSEQGYQVAGPKPDEVSIVKKGFYSYTGGDGKVYTVTYWADHTGFHAFGEHLPTPPPTPLAIQASLDQIAKEDAAKAEAEKNKQQNQHQHGYHPQGQEIPKPIAPQQPAQPQPQQPPKPQYPTPQPPPQPQYPKPQPPPQPQYPQQTYYPPQQQQTYYPPASYSPPQSGYGRRR